jgi:hypothetical protein
VIYERLGLWVGLPTRVRPESPTLASARSREVALLLAFEEGGHRPSLRFRPVTPFQEKIRVGSQFGNWNRAGPSAYFQPAGRLSTRTRACRKGTPNETLHRLPRPDEYGRPSAVRRRLWQRLSSVPTDDRLTLAPTGRCGSAHPVARQARSSSMAGTRRTGLGRLQLGGSRRGGRRPRAGSRRPVRCSGSTRSQMHSRGFSFAVSGARMPV